MKKSKIRLVLLSVLGLVLVVILVLLLIPSKDITFTNAHQERVNSLVFSPDGKKLASASLDGTVKLWDMEKKTNLVVFEYPATNFYSVAFSPDSKKLVGVNATSSLFYGTQVITNYSIS
jgi:WD40 repeat protein